MEKITMTPNFTAADMGMAVKVQSAASDTDFAGLLKAKDANANTERKQEPLSKKTESGSDTKAEKAETPKKTQDDGEVRETETDETAAKQAEEAVLAGVVFQIQTSMSQQELPVQEAEAETLTAADMLTVTEAAAPGPVQETAAETQTYEELTEAVSVTEEQPKVAEESSVTEEQPKVAEESSVTEEQPKVAEESSVTEEQPKVAEESSVTEEQPKVAEESSVTGEQPKVIEESPKETVQKAKNAEPEKTSEPQKATEDSSVQEKSPVQVSDAKASENHPESGADGKQSAKPEEHMSVYQGQLEQTQFSYETQKTGGDTVSVQTTPQTFPQDIGNALANNLPKNGNVLTLELEPASLGKLTIQVAYEGGRAAVSIFTSNPKTLELLSQNAGEIAQILEEKTGQETVVYMPNTEQEPDPQQEGREQNRDRERRDEQEYRDEKQPDSFAQQLRLGLV